MGFTYWLKNQLETFIRNPYRWLWSKVGGRPFTFILRDLWNSAEFIMQAFWFWLAVLVLYWLGVTIPTKTLLAGWVIYIFGYINGHLYWGTDWKKGEKGG